MRWYEFKCDQCGRNEEIRVEEGQGDEEFYFEVCKDCGDIGAMWPLGDKQSGNGEDFEEGEL